MKIKKTITVQEAVDLIKNSKGKFMTVKFIKRTNNELRTMNCRTGVRKGVKGVGHKTATGLITVYDMTNKGFRTINISGLREVRVNKKTYTIL